MHTRLNSPPLTMADLPTLAGTHRCVISCSGRHNSIDHTGTVADISANANQIVRRVIEAASGNCEKAIFLGLSQSKRHLYVVFDYDNPTHSECQIVGFKVGKRIKHITVPGERVNERVRQWRQTGNFPCIVRVTFTIMKAITNLATGNTSRLPFPRRTTQVQVGHHQQGGEGDPWQGLSRIAGEAPAVHGIIPPSPHCRCSLAGLVLGAYDRRSTLPHSDLGLHCTPHHLLYKTRHNHQTPASVQSRNHSRRSVQ